MTWGPLWPDYSRFHALAVRTGDVDPVYPVLRRLAVTYGPAGIARLSFLHVAYYDLGSALRAYHRLGIGGLSLTEVDQILRLPSGTERRSHRNPDNLRRHLDALLAVGDHFGDHYRAVLALAGPPPLSYDRLYAGLIGIWGNGRWAAYKTCELLSHSLREFMGGGALRLEPTDMGMRYSSGPRHGLALLDPSLPTNESAPALRRLDAAARALVDRLEGEGREATMATAETTLCDFHSLVKGRYYVGHDIDTMGWQLRRAMYAETTAGDAFAALEEAYHVAAACFPPEYWGHEPDKMRRTHYKRTGEIVER